MANQARESMERATNPPLQAAEPLDLRRRRRPAEALIQGLLFVCGTVSILTTIGIVFVLGREAWLFFGDEAVSFVEFVTSTTWVPSAGQFGILPLVSATLLTSLIAMCVAVPLGLGAAIYLSEYATPRARSILKPVLEVLSGIPTVVYGFFALTFMTPLLRSIFGRDTVEIYNMASAGLVMGIMILPLISSLGEDALSAVPRTLREGAYGLGATRWETATKVVLPAAISGIIAALIIAVSRAFHLR
jgi:phosphate transport system permease protein